MSLVKTPKKHKKNEVFDLFFQSKTHIFPVHKCVCRLFWGSIKLKSAL